MPYTWVPPKVFLKYKKVKIYFIYRNDFDEETRDYSYGYSIHCNDDGEDAFDIRDVAHLVNMDANNVNNHVEILKALINNGILTQDGIKE